MSNSNADEPPRKYSTHPPPPPSLSSLPDEIILRCLALIRRSYHLNISWVSKHLKALVRSPDLNLLRSTLPKTSLHVCFQESSTDYDDDHDDDDSYFHWFTLNETSTTEYQLVPNPKLPSPPQYGSSTAAVESKIFFIGGSTEPSTDLWILDTRSGTMTQGPSMSVNSMQYGSSTVVVGSKIFFIGGSTEPSTDLWILCTRSGNMTQGPSMSVPREKGDMENVRKTSRCSASDNVAPPMVEYEEINVYNPREFERERMVRMVSQRLERGQKDMLNDSAYLVCVVEDVLYAFFNQSGIMWFNTTLNVWRRLLDRDGKQLPFIFHADAKAEYEDGKLVILYMLREKEIYHTVAKSVRCMLVSLHRSGDMICGTVDWSGTMGTVPDSVNFLHCLAVSD
ncbi:hypothetical protein Bca4012_094786 [Brassica carinata]